MSNAIIRSLFLKSEKFFPFVSCRETQHRALICEVIDELNYILNIYDSNFSRFRFTIAIDKTQTLAYNVSKDVMSSNIS